MPRSSQVSRRYVRALSAVAEDQAGSSQKILAELRSFVEALQSSKDLRTFFFSPIISRSEKKEILGEIKDKISHTQKFLSVLIDANRLSALPEIVDDYEAAMEAAAGEVSVAVESARPLSAQASDEIRSLLQDEWKKKVKMRTSVNPALIGGFVAQGGGKTLNASVAHQFELLKQSLNTR